MFTYLMLPALTPGFCLLTGMSSASLALRQIQCFPETGSPRHPNASPLSLALIVFCTKFRRHTLTSEKRDFLKSSMEQVALAYNSQILEWNGGEDHILMLLRYPPTVVLSSLVGALKSKSASAVLDRFGSVYLGKHTRTFWSSGFFLCSAGGATLEILKAYIENQGH